MHPRARALNHASRLWASFRDRSVLCNIFACLVLATGVCLIYWPTSGFGFINLDDPVYVTENSHIQTGLSWEGIKWAGQTVVAANWHPVTLISHMVDCQWFGLNAGAHHINNFLLHGLNALLLFFLLQQMAIRWGPAFCVAALFAWHPCHVESVAWISERKDVLSTFFGLCSMLAYVRFAAKEDDPCPPRAKRFYLLSVFLFCLALMAKPMLVTLPFVLLLLDYWPLFRFTPQKGELAGRYKHASAVHLFVEKVPFILVAAVTCGVTLWAQHAAGAVASLHNEPMTVRLVNATESYFRYVGEMAWPENLSVIYPFTDAKPDPVFWLAAFGLLAITVILLRLRNAPYMIVGWLWFLGTLVPVIGLVQVGVQAMADRYTYFPSIGFFILVVLGLAELAQRFSHGKTVLVALTILVFGGYLQAAHRQVEYWRDSETLFRRAVAVTRNNFMAFNRLGIALEDRGDWSVAMECFKNATKALPEFVDAHCNLGECYWRLNQPDEAKAEFQFVFRLEPNNAKAHYFLGNVLLSQDDVGGAIAQYRCALQLSPEHADLHCRLATALIAAGQVEEGLSHYQEAVRLKPDWAEALNDLSWTLATQADARSRDGKQAVGFALRAVALTHTNDPGKLDTLAAAYAENGQFQFAQQAADKAVELARAAGNLTLAETFTGRLRLYEKSQPFRETSPSAEVQGKSPKNFRSR